MLTVAAPTAAWESYVGETLHATIERIESGNIIYVKSGGKEFPIRFYGIGIPTEKQPFGAEAHQTLMNLLPKGANIILTTVNRDNEGIISALVQYKDHSVNNRLIDMGYAWVDRSTCKAFFCRRWHIQEHLAVKEGRGLWSLNLSSPPWQWQD